MQESAPGSAAGSCNAVSLLGFFEHRPRQRRRQKPLHFKPPNSHSVQVALIWLCFTLMATLAVVGLQRATHRRSTAVPATAAPTARTDDGIELQAGFACGAWVYDRGHGGQQRGYGVVAVAADPADDGTARWCVDWAAGGRLGGRTTAIKETYLELALVPNSARCSPTAIGQRVLVVLGKSKASKGEIVGKVGRCTGLPAVEGRRRRANGVQLVRRVVRICSRSLLCYS